LNAFDKNSKNDSEILDDGSEEFSVLFTGQDEITVVRNTAVPHVLQSQESNNRRKMSTDTSSDKETSFDDHLDTFSSEDFDLEVDTIDRLRRISLQEEYLNSQQSRAASDRLDQRRLSLLSDIGPSATSNSKKRWTLSIRHDIMDALRKEMEVETSQAFPSLNSELMESLELEKDGPGVSKLSDQELEKKFALLSLAMKADKENLQNRVASQGRLRDSHEKKLEDAVYQIKANLSGLLAQGGSGSFIDILRNILKQLQVLQQSVSRLSGIAEAVGAVTQENKVAYAVEVYIRHVEKLKTKQEKEQRELDEFRRMLNSMGDIPPSASTEKEIEPRRISSPAQSSSDTQNRGDSGEESDLLASICQNSSQDSSLPPDIGEDDHDDDPVLLEGGVHSFLQRRFRIGWLAEVDLEEVDWEQIWRNFGKLSSLLIVLLSMFVVFTLSSLVDIH